MKREHWRISAGARPSIFIRTGEGWECSVPLLPHRYCHTALATWARLGRLYADDATLLLPRSCPATACMYHAVMLILPRRRYRAADATLLPLPHCRCCAAATLLLPHCGCSTIPRPPMPRPPPPCPPMTRPLLLPHPPPSRLPLPHQPPPRPPPPRQHRLSTGRPHLRATQPLALPLGRP